MTKEDLIARLRFLGCPAVMNGAVSTVGRIAQVELPNW